MSKQDYYIGWGDSIPDRNRKALKKILIPVFILIPLLSLMLVFFMKPFNNHQFEFGNTREFTGIYYEKPFPVLVLDKGQTPMSFDSNALLVGYGKNGAKGFMQSIEKEKGPLSDKKIKIKGTLIYGDGKTLIELTDKEKSLVEIIDKQPRFNPSSAIKMVELQGEILDPKCWFGVMKPGEGKVHKSCAIRCVSGGIPPVLRTKVNGKNRYYILKGDHGEDINEDVLGFIAEPVSIRGETFQINGWDGFKIDTKKIEYTN